MEFIHYLESITLKIAETTTDLKDQVLNTKDPVKEITVEGHIVRALNLRKIHIRGT